MRYRRRNRRKQEEVAPRERVRQIAAMNVYQDANPDEVIRRIRSMTYGSTSSEQVKLRLAMSGAEAV